MNRQVAVVVHQRMIEVDDAFDERGAEDPDAAEVEQVD
jgi:hypothetical protein